MEEKEFGNISREPSSATEESHARVSGQSHNDIPTAHFVFLFKGVIRILEVSNQHARRSSRPNVYRRWICQNPQGEKIVDVRTSDRRLRKTPPTDMLQRVEHLIRT